MYKRGRAMKLKEKIVGAVTILVLSIVFLFFGYFSSKDKDVEFEEVFTNNMNTNTNAVEPVTSKSEGAKVSESEVIVADIKGAVKNPREYELKAGARIRDLIEAAGGLTEDADENRIKFSQILNDEDCIKIYKIGEAPEENNEIFSESPSAAGGQNSSGKININKATAAELQTLPGIGEVKAQSIIDYRESVGIIKSVDELTNITGIGAKTVDKLRDMVDIK